MASDATILLADISGFTDFVSGTALEHSSHIVNELLELLVESNKTDLTVSEIEGDAILFYRLGAAIDCDVLVNQCLDMFEAFHRRLKIIERDTICQCGACQTASGLGLKFIVHRGTVQEIKVAQFTKASGLDMIVAHRLLKNEVPAREYLLTTRQYLDVFGGRLPCDLTWTASTQTYGDVGDIAVQYALLGDIKRQIPDPPPRKSAVIPRGDDAVELDINAPLMAVYMKVIDVEGKRKWVLGLDDLEREPVTARLEERHVCYFQGMRVDFRLLHGEIGPSKAVYLEEAAFHETPFKHQQMYTLTANDSGSTHMRFEIKWQEDPAPPDEMKQMYMAGCTASFEVFKEQIEST